MRNTIRCLPAALALACGIHFSTAQATEHETSTHAASATQDWEMLPGESLRSLAKLFYPNNRYMQQRFITTTQGLNREELGALAADQPFEQATALRIPDLHALSAQAKPRAAKVRHKVAATPRPEAVAPAVAQSLQASQPTARADAAQVEAATKRNQERRAKLEDLQKRMKALEDQSRTMQQDLGKNNPNAAASAAQAPAAATEAAPKPRKRVVAE